ncbi:MAG: hypothetical protein QNJ37_20325 [Crocosphaera sp.]|nr:hypothetical protein [Crocosphaera sp.]
MLSIYLDQNETRGIIYKIKDFITQHDARIRKSLARKIITEELIENDKIIVLRISKRMSETLKNKSRQEACEIICGEFPKQFKILSQSFVKDVKEIEKAKKKAKKRDKHTCQITGRKPANHDQFNLAVHHLYCSKKYPRLATVDVNLITIAENIHKEFHGSLGGFNKPCTLDDFIEFVHYHYPEHQPELTVKLQKAKKELGKVS